MPRAASHVGGTTRQIRRAVDQEPNELGFLRRAHDPILRETGGDDLCDVESAGARQRAKAAREQWDALRAELVVHDLRLVVSAAKRFRRPDVPFLELIQAGSLGLNRAVEKFDPELGYRLSTYGVWGIEQAVVRGVQRCARSIRLRHARARSAGSLPAIGGRRTLQTAGIPVQQIGVGQAVLEEPESRGEVALGRLRVALPHKPAGAGYR